MDDRNDARFHRLLTALRALLAPLEPAAGAAVPRYCCGVEVAARPAADDMPTPASCCGVRV